MKGLTQTIMWIAIGLSLGQWIGASAVAKVFSNSYIQFELPDQWQCVAEDPEWICSSTDPKESREAIIIMSAKVAGPSDNLESYRSFILQPKTLPTRSGTPLFSKVLSTRDRLLNGHTWVEGIHLGSEIPDYYTLYLATVKDRLAILVSFSAEKSRAAKFNPTFVQALQSLRITASQELLAPSVPSGAAKDAVQMPQPIETGTMTLQGAPWRSYKVAAALAGLLLLGVMGGWLWRSRQK